MNVEINQVLTQLVAFLIMLWVLNKFAWKPLFEVMEERKRKIQAEFDSIEEQKALIKKLTDELNAQLAGMEAQSRLKIQEAIDEGRKIAAAIQEQAQKEAQALLAEGREDIAKELGKAKVQLRNELVAMVLTATEKMIRVNLTPQKQNELIDDFAEQTELQ